MSWMDNLNLVVEYIEENLDKEISYNVASKIMNVSVYHMQKLFACIIGIPISEYIRKRRLTKAAFDLQCGIKVIDVALKYGYTSPTAFTRAFKLQHNMSPSEVKKSINNLVSYPPITFKLIIQGVESMKYRIVKKDEIKIVGVKTKISSDFEKNFNNIPKFWSDVFSKNIICESISMMNQDLKGVLGVSIMNDNQIDGYYYIGVATDQEPPEGMESIVIKSSEWAIFSGKGTSADIQNLQKRVITEWLPTSGYNWSNNADIEVYLDNNPEDMEFEVWLPIVK